MTIKDIARESGYAIGTVSRVLNNAPGVSEKARESVMAVVNKYGFVLNANAKELKQQSCVSIAIIVKGRFNALFSTILEKILQHIGQTGYITNVVYIDEDANEVQRAIQICREKRPIGILFLGANNKFFDDSFSQVNVPCVVVTGQISTHSFANLSSVTVDDMKAGEAATDILLSMGHRKIGVIGCDLQVSETSQLRMEGCINSHKKHGISFDSETQLQKARFSHESGYEAMNALLDRIPDITAVFAMSDSMAIGAIRALYDRGLRVPEDISVVGFDGLEIASYYNPKLYTIGQDTDMLAQSSVNCLLELVEQRSAACRMLVPFYVNHGESVCPPGRKVPSGNI